MEVSPVNQTVMEPQAEKQKSIASFFTVKKGTSAHEITPASVMLAKTAASTTAKAKEAKAAAKDTKGVKAIAKKASTKAAVEPKANLIVDLDADDKSVPSYFPGTCCLHLIHTPTLSLTRGTLSRLVILCGYCFAFCLFLL